jgi:hypothetical protein
MTETRWPAGNHLSLHAALALRLHRPAERRRLALSSGLQPGLDRLDDEALLRWLAWQVQTGRLSLDEGRPGPRGQVRGPGVRPSAAAGPSPEPPEPPRARSPQPPAPAPAAPVAAPPAGPLPAPAADELEALAARRPGAVAAALLDGAGSGADEVEIDLED